MSSSVDGLVSGLSTSSLISQLMQVEAAPQNRLKAKVQTAETTVASYQSVNNKLSALKGAADTLSQLSTWRAVAPTSSSSTVTATATGGTNSASGVTTFDVVALAKPQTDTYKAAAGANVMDPSVNDLTITFADPDVAPVVITGITDKTPEGVAAAINTTKGSGLRAGVVTTSDGSKVLQVTGAKTGTDNAFTINGLNLPAENLTAASDAEIRVGAEFLQDGFTPNPASYKVTSTSNTFTGLLSGVSVTVSKIEQGVTIDAQTDVAGIAGKFQAFVDAANAVLDEVSAQTKYDAATKKGSPLTGDFMVRELSQTLMGAVSGGLTYANPKYNENLPTDPNTNPETIAFGSLAQVGIQLDRGGKLTFDAAKFTAAYNEDPTKIQEAMIGLGDNFEEQTRKQTVSVTNVITGRRQEIDNFNQQIDNWDTRLAARKLALQRQYTGLETALGNLKNQSNWLAGQLAGLG